MSYERKHIQRMAGYVPGFQPRMPAIKLNTNENPYPPGQAVAACLAALSPEVLQRYPDPTADAFRATAARVHRLTPDHVVATNGGDELLRLALTTFLEPNRPLGVLTPGYGLYSVLAQIHQAPLCAVPLGDDWHLPDGVADRWNAALCQLAIVTNPHAPSGALTPVATLDRLAGIFRGVLLIDEAYVDFVDPDLHHDATALIGRHRNVLLLRTLSKGYSLAGLRLAYGLGDTQLIAPILGKTKDSYNVDAIAQAVGAATLADTASAAASWSAVRASRACLQRELAALGLSSEPTQANFLLVSVPPRSPWGGAEALHRRLMDRGIYVRWFDEDRLRDRLRITVGTPAENDVLIAALADNPADVQQAL
jgi:histidinol-phosphate aminotransferase